MLGLRYRGQVIEDDQARAEALEDTGLAERGGQHNEENGECGLEAVGRVGKFGAGVGGGKWEFGWLV